MTEKNVNQRMFICGVALLIACVLLYPPGQKLRPGLDIAGGTSLIFEIDTKDSGQDPTLAERVKTLLQKRVDPKGIYALNWRVQGRNRIEVQMPLPPKDAMGRREVFADALKDLFDQELKRGKIEEALRKEGPARDEALRKLARRDSDEALANLQESEAARALPSDQQNQAIAKLAERIGDAAAALKALKPEDVQARRAAIDAKVAEREKMLFDAANRYDAMLAAREALARGPAASQPASEPTTTAPEGETASQPTTQETPEEVYRDATELFEDAVDAVLATNLNRRRFQEIVDLDEKSRVRINSLKELRASQPDLDDRFADVIAKHATYRSGRHFLESPADLKRLLRGAGKLEFRILAAPNPENATKYDRYRRQLKEGRDIVPGDSEGWFKIDNPLQFFNLDSPAQLQTYDYRNAGNWVCEKRGDDYFVLAKMSTADGLLQDEKIQRRWKLVRARVDRDERSRWCVAFTLDPVGGQMFSVLTRNNKGNPLCILVDNVAYSAPNIQSEIRTNGQITGEFSQDKVQYLVNTMEGGTLPGKLKDTPLSERTVGSSLGESNRDSAVRAGLIGMIAVIAVMMIYYMMCGAIANVAMLLNMLLVLGALAMLGARITLDGIAGLILTVGMSVDANVLIYERMREEKARGSSLRMVIKNGYDRAFSTIFDSNMTTLLTCLIIYYAGSEEVKGFGLTLGWGVALNLFTAVFVTRTLFAFLLKYNLIKDVKMLKLIGVPNINWVRLSKFLVPVTVMVTLLGVGALCFRGAKDVFDIEFLGGVAAEFELKQAGLDDKTIGQRLLTVGNDIANQDAPRVARASIEPLPGETDVYRVGAEGISSDRLVALLTEPLESENVLQRDGIKPQTGSSEVLLYVQPEVTLQALTDKIHALSTIIADEGKKLGGANVNAVLEVGGVAQKGLVWNVTTTVTNMRLVQEAIKAAIGDDMKVQPKTEYIFRGDGDKPYPITDRLLSSIIPDLPPGADTDVTDYLGGTVIRLDQLNPPMSAGVLRERLDNMLFQPDFQEMPRRDFKVIGLTAAPQKTGDTGDPLYTSMAIVTVDPDIRYSDNPTTWFTGFAQGEVQLAKTALASEQTLRKVMQFKPQIAAGASQQAIIALVLSWIMIIAYVWIRFGRLAYGMGGVIALVHDVLLALAFVGFSGLIANATLPGWLGGFHIGRALLVEDFRINMPIVAALLTIVGYSVNDTIVVFDRIRENRGRLGIVTPEVVNDAINQTLSRTILTVFTVFIVIVIAYIFGGSSIRGFNYCMLIGVLTGCYSSIAIASPLLLFHLHFRKGGIAATAR